MALERRSDVDIGDDLSINDKKWLTLKIFARVVESSRCAEDDRRFDGVVDLHAELRTVAEGVDHRLRLMMKVDDNLTDAKLCEILGHVTDERLAEERYSRLGSVYRQW